MSLKLLNVRRVIRSLRKVPNEDGGDWLVYNTRMDVRMDGWMEDRDDSLET